jgi:Tol biopolymer transport system component
MMNRVVSTLLGMVIFLSVAPVAGVEKKPSADSDVLVFSMRTWKGEYFSKDIPGGVQSTPTLGAIYTIAADGSGLKQVVAPGKGVDFPHFSPDDRWIYFQANPGQARIYRCKLDGKDKTIVSATDKLGKKWKDAFGYFLSSDGRKMVYTVHDGSAGKVVLANADGSDPTLVAPSHGYLYMASLSGNGDRVVYSGPGIGYRIRLVKLPDGKPVILTPDHPQSFVPRFTPDGRTIVFIRRDGDVYSVAADGTNLRRLTKGNSYVEFRLSDKDQHGSTDGPDISPDGKRIAYIKVADGVANVWTMNLDGSKQRQITRRKSRCGRVRWSPNGKRLAFVSFEGAFPQLFVIPAEGGEARQITRLKGAVYFHSWSARPRGPATPVQGAPTQPADHRRARAVL